MKALQFLFSSLIQLFLWLVACFCIVLSFLFYFFPNESQQYWDNIKKRWINVYEKKKKSKQYRNFGVKLPKYNIHGIDVSHYQGDINWEEVKKMNIKGDSISFVFIKATEGNNYIDKSFEKNWKEAQSAGLMCGAYHYFKPDIDGKEQAKHFINQVKMTKGNLPPVLDIEEIGEKKWKEVKKELKIWLDLIEKEYNIQPIIYSNRIFLEDNLGEEFKKYIVWVAQYKNLNPPEISFKNWTFWQHSSEGNVNGINFPVDLNVFESENINELKNIRKK